MLMFLLYIFKLFINFMYFIYLIKIVILLSHLVPAEIRQLLRPIHYTTIMLTIYNHHVDQNVTMIGVTQARRGVQL